MPQQVDTFQGPFWCWPDIVRNALEKGEFWDQQIQPAIDEADRSGWALDLGANIGWFTVYMAKRFAQVIAVEAHPATYSLLQQNLTACGVSNVWTYQLAAYATTQLLHLATGEMLGWAVPHETDLDQTVGAASLAFVPEHRRLDGLTVQAHPIDHFVPTGARVTCIKTDVQGCDLQALRGLSQTIARCRPLIIFEYEMGASQWHGDTWQDYLDFFIARDYAVQRIREDLWDYVARPR